MHVATGAIAASHTDKFPRIMGKRPAGPSEIELAAKRGSPVLTTAEPTG